MYAIKDILNSKYLLFKKCNSAFGRMVVSCVKADLMLDTAFHISYKAVIQITHKKQVEYNLVHYKQADIWYLEETDTNISYQLVLCTNNLVEVLELNDTFTYYEDGEYHGFKVVGFYPKYKVIYVLELNTKERHKIGKIMRRFNSAPVISIKN